MRFAIETEAIDDSTTPAHIKRLLDRWKRFGVLVYPRRGDAALANAIAVLSPAPRKYWKSAWAKVIKNNGNAYRWTPNDGIAFEWEKIDTPGALANLDDEFEVAILEETRAAVLEIPDGESRCFGQVEGMRLWDIDVSEKFSCSETLSSASIGIGESTTHIWNQRFQRVAAYSREVAIVDQYAARDNNLNGILRLLRFLDRDAGSCHVSVYSSLDPNGGGAKFIESQIRAKTAKFSGSGIRSVEVLLFDEWGFKKYAHDRHLRFDNNVFRIGRGIRIFEHSRVREATDVDLLILKTGTREQKEMDLANFATRVHVFRVPMV